MNIATIMLNPGDKFAWVHQNMRWVPTERDVEIKSMFKLSTAELMSKIEGLYLEDYRTMVKGAADMITPDHCVGRTYRPFHTNEVDESTFVYTTKISSMLMPAKSKFERQVCLIEDPWVSKPYLMG